jgi:uncharacterized membrane protein YagU involved in acid resistance
MITWRLWQAFKHPPSDHPIFQRMTLNDYSDQIELFSLLQRILIQGQIWLWPLVFMLNMRALTLMIFSGTLYGALWAVRISGTIAAERKSGRYDLLCLSPGGEVCAMWAICTGCLHQYRAFHQINSQEAWSVRLILFIPIVISTPFIVRQVFAVTLSTTFTGMLAIIVVFYLDHVQSIVFGTLAGVLASHYAPNPLDQRLWALAGFLALQITSYVILVVLNLLIFPLFDHNWGGWYAEIGVPLLMVASVYIVREIMLRSVWKSVKRRLGSTAAELDTLFQRSMERTPGSYADPQVVARTP